MSSSKEELISLIKKYNRGTATPEEIVFLEKYYQYFNKEEKISGSFSVDETKELSSKIFSRIQHGINSAPVIPFLKRTWFRVAAAAAIIITICGGSYFLITRSDKPEIAANEPQEKRFKNDVAAPANTKATITLADGRTVSIDSLTSIAQGDVNVTKTADGKIIYTTPSAASAPTAVAYNTLSNPRGSKVIDMQLSDGSHVWLNSGSSVTYPIAFVGNERKVTITGEAYFEVKHNSAIPFKVNKGEMEVLVLGTHFNVNAYDDETDIKVTLLEGSVRVSNLTTHDSRLIASGQQALVTANGQLTTNNDVDLYAVMAWKNGLFKFKDATIEPIMRQIEKWYDVEVVFEDKVTEHFITTIPRDVPVSQVLKYLETTGRVHFRIEGRKVTVLK